MLVGTVNQLLSVVEYDKELNPVPFYKAKPNLLGNYTDW